ncbi:MAG: hypothetical protein V1701_02020 [Planctomycetota bacterium]
MITINLLPEDKRYKERTPLPRFLLLNAAIIILLLLVFWNAVLMAKLSGKDKVLDSEQDNLGKLQQQTIDFEKKAAEEKNLSEWKKAVDSVISTRPFSWYEAVDYLCDLISGSPTIWITSLRGEEGSGSKASAKGQVAYTLSIGCLSATDNVEKMTEFRIKLRHHPELGKIFDLGYDDALNLVKVAMPDYTEEFALKFDIELRKGKPAPKTN